MDDSDGDGNIPLRSLNHVSIPCIVCARRILKDRLCFLRL